MRAVNTHLTSAELHNERDMVFQKLFNPTLRLAYVLAHSPGFRIGAEYIGGIIPPLLAMIAVPKGRNRKTVKRLFMHD